MRNMRNPPVSIFNYLRVFNMLRKYCWERVLPEEPFFCPDFPTAYVKSQNFVLLLYCRRWFSRDFQSGQY